MKKIISSAFILLAALSLPAQITLSSSDLPVMGDTVRISYGAGATGAPVLDTNYFWDYSMLVPNAQYVFNFENPANTSYFGLNSTFVSSYAVYNWSPDSIPFIPILPTNLYDFFKKSSSSYKQVGQGYSLFNFPIPIFYNPSDRIYKFPMNYSDLDSNDASFTAQIPTIFYRKEDIHRVNQYAGWGSLLTPYASFPSVCLIKSQLTLTDTISLDTLGISFPPFTTYRNEYKWFAPGSKMPVLQINTNVNGGNETVSNVLYKDSIQPVIQIGIAENNVISGFTVFPNPAKDNFTLTINSKNPQAVKLMLHDVAGKQVYAEQLNLPAGAYQKQINVNALKLAKGMYVLSVLGDKFFDAKKVVVE